MSGHIRAEAFTLGCWTAPDNTARRIPNIEAVNACVFTVDNLKIDLVAPARAVDLDLTA